MQQQAHLPATPGQVDRPEIVAEVRALADAYEAALTGNDVPALDGFFRDAPETVRIGAGKNSSARPR